MAKASVFVVTVSAASRSLPLGTVAKVKYLETGQTTTVTSQDHGPFVEGGALDISRAAANLIGTTKDAGLARVQVSSAIVPQRDGTPKPGAGAAEP